MTTRNPFQFSAESDRLSTILSQALAHMIAAPSDTFALPGPCRVANQTLRIYTVNGVVDSMQIGAGSSNHFIYHCVQWLARASAAKRQPECNEWGGDRAFSTRAVAETRSNHTHTYTSAAPNARWPSSHHIGTTRLSLIMNYLGAPNHIAFCALLAAHASTAFGAN